MRSLYDFEVLTHTFYRTEYILSYIERRMNQKDTWDAFEIETITQTILHALVESSDINPKVEGLDFSHLQIVPLKEGVIPYQKHPLVMGIPNSLKERARKESLWITGEIPLSIHMARPASQTHFCIYDANTAVSVLFDQFTFLKADYDSPTRKGFRVTDRPFLEANLDGVSYLFDLLTKRVFKKDEFAILFHLVEKDVVVSSQFDKEKKQMYKEQTRRVSSNYSSFLMFIENMVDLFKTVPNCEEYLYELEESRKFFPDAFRDAERQKQDILFQKDSFFGKDKKEKIKKS